jgi:hypothetical protein
MPWKWLLKKMIGMVWKNGDHLASFLQHGDNFAIKAKEDNVEGMEFYIIMCTNIIFIIESDFSCCWGTWLQ